jgi:hypothetical protein
MKPKRRSKRNESCGDFVSPTTTWARDNPSLPFGERGQIFVVSSVPAHGELRDVRASRTHVKHFEGER